jgi:hypothetical protein
VGIPTIAGRERYLAAALKTCVTQVDDDFEIVVSDNSPGGARELVQSFGDARIRYVRPDAYLPMSAHWDFMASHFTGDMITIIGDDDALMPGCLRRVREIVSTYGMRPIQHALANYCWPDFPEVGSRDKLWFIHSPAEAIRVQDSRAYLTALCEARTRYIDGPMFYHNFIPGALVRRLRAGGSMFHRAAPDVYTAITIAAHTESFVSTGEVLTLAGQGARANGAAVRDGRADGKRFLGEMRAPAYATRFPPLTVQLMTLDAILEASDRYGLADLPQRINYGEQFCAAANECLDMPDRGRGMRELVTVAAEARRRGCLGYLLRNRGGKLLEKAGHRLRGGSPQPEVHPYTPGVKSAVPDDVRDVYGAALHLQRLLAQD